MFSGIVEGIAEVAVVTEDGEKRRLGLRSPVWSSDMTGRERSINLGDSIAISGVCLTVSSFAEGVAYFDIGTETIARTTLGTLRVGSRVNIERSLRLGERIQGHLVFGHVDCMATVIGRKSEASTVRFEIRLPSDLRPLIAARGSVALDGVSLTVAGLGADSFSVQVVPFTIEQTILSFWEVGSIINLEVDMLARYVHASVTGK